MANRAHGLGPGEQESSALLRPLDVQSHRYKRVGISCALLQQMLTQDSDSGDFPWASRCIEGLPAGARLVYSFIDWVGTEQLLGMIFEHDDWPEVPEGQQVPEFTPVFREYRKDGASGG